LAEGVEPALVLDREIAERGNAALHELAERDFAGGPLAGGVGLEEKEVFVQRALVELRRADLVGQSLQQGLGRRVGVDVDKAGEDEEASPVDLALRRIRLRGADT